MFWKYVATLQGNTHAEVWLQESCFAMQSDFTEIILRHGCSSINLLHIFRTPFLRTPMEGGFCHYILPCHSWWKSPLLLCFIVIQKLMRYSLPNSWFCTSYYVILLVIKHWIHFYYSLKNFAVIPVVWLYQCNVKYSLAKLLWNIPQIFNHYKVL